MPRQILSNEETAKSEEYKRYALTDSGVSPRAIPGQSDAIVYADSDEHTEEGHITEDGKVRSAMVEKRLYKKMAGISAEGIKPKIYIADDAEIVLLGFGSTYGVIKDAVDLLTHLKIGFIHLSQIWPFPADEMSRLLKGFNKIFTVENNAGAQLAGLLRQETGIKVTGSILRYDGRPFDLDYMIENIEEAIKK